MKNIVRIFVCLLLLLISPVEASEYVSNFTTIPAVEHLPIRVATWKSTPIVIVCEHAPITETQINSALTFWKGLGHYFQRVQYKHDPLDKCKQETPVGYILVHLVTQQVVGTLDPDSLAVTHFYVDNTTKNVDWAVIYFKNDIRGTVLEHEIGHALGYLHYNKINHLMNSKWMQGGWDKEGLTNKHQ